MPGLIHELAAQATERQRKAAQGVVDVAHQLTKEQLLEQITFLMALEFRKGITLTIATYRLGEQPINEAPFGEPTWSLPPGSA